MLVDDEVVIVLQLQALLERQGYKVVATASSGEEAVRAAGEHEPDLILMDIVMEGQLDGIGAADRIRSDLGIPIVFLTAHADEMLIDRAKKTAPFGYILKPFQDWQINAAIEIALHKKELEQQLELALDDRELQIKDRTRELTETNEKLEIEIQKNKRALRLLRKRETQLEETAFDLKEANAAMEVLLTKRDRDRQELEDKLMLNIKELIIPYIEKLRQTDTTAKQDTYLEIIESNLAESTTPIGKGMSDEYLKLTPAEIQVANLLKQGKMTKHMAEIMGLSPRTVESYRDSIRNKLGLKHKKINLRTFLISKH